MYSPKIDERFIPALYQLKLRAKKPMTALVNEAVEEYLARHGMVIGSRISDAREKADTDIYQPCLTARQATTVNHSPKVNREGVINNGREEKEKGHRKHYHLPGQRDPRSPWQ